ncbi:hypothetical protein ABEB36_014691 [Hypothenemus hampei]|uniref:DUF4758 domain-containing protein n=1 Tax=Hypothenemus hampei TaxID=57062 RepID=A0ABD1E2J4_HYPHA
MYSDLLKLFQSHIILEFSFLRLCYITTVLLVDHNGAKNSLGRFLSVKPDLGLITSTARTFIQDGVTTEYATQVLGTTLDNGRLYAHLLTKTSRVLYDHDSQTKRDEPQQQQKTWQLPDKDNKNFKNFIRNTDFISPDQTVHVFPTSIDFHSGELLKESSSNNERIPYKGDKAVQIVKVKDLTHENLIIHNDNPAENLKPSKVKQWDNLPTFTVKNEFSPSGFSFLGDLPEFDAKTERSRLTTQADRKARLLFKAGLVKPNPKDLQTVTYSGFADFTTTVANTVIVFTPHSTESLNNVAQTTKIQVEPTIKPSSVHRFAFTKEVSEDTTTEKQYPTFVTTEEPPTTTNREETSEGPNTMVINKEDRDGKNRPPDEPVDLAAKFSVLAKEQKPENNQQTIPFSSDVVQPSESHSPIMLSTPSQEDISKILASIQAQAAVATQPLESVKTTSFFDESSSAIPSVTGGATTIFFEDDDFSFEPSTTRKLEDSSSEGTTEQPEATTEEPTTPEFVNEIVDSSGCLNGTQVVPIKDFKTLTYLTTFYIPLETSTSTSIRSRIVVSTVSTATIPCNVGVTKSVEPLTTTENVQEANTETKSLTTTTEQEEITTTTNNPTTEDVSEAVASATTTESIITTTSEADIETTTTESPEEDEDEEGDEIEVIFKTLYTTYTYLTTYFQDSTSSVASRIVVTTNVITSTLDPAEATDSALAGLLHSEPEEIIPSRTVTFEDLADIQPTSLLSEESFSTTPSLENIAISPGGVKTFYTTYTYFTTIFVDGETEISSRTEVYTNYVTPSATAAEVLATKTPENKEDILQNRLRNLKFNNSLHEDVDNDVIPASKGYVTLSRGYGGNEDSQYETISTRVRSSTSKGDERIIDSLDKRNILIEDQIVSESNNDSEILPSPPTLLLQTSYTTFTYFTTVYHGTTSSDVVSRLETVTNFVTTTLTPTQTITSEDLSLPVTYFTTFTYWTTLYKEGQTKVTSREETISNVVTPEFKSTEGPEGIIPLISTTIEPTATLESSIEATEPLVPSTVGEDDLTTFYTTYTYYTTSYIGDDTVLNSRLETVTNVLNKSDTNVGRAVNSVGSNTIQEPQKTTNFDIKPTGLLSTIVSTVNNYGTSTIFSTDVFGTYIDGLYAKVLESTSSILNESSATPTTSTIPLKPTGVVSINQGKIVDADGISTLFYTTQAVGTYIDNLYAQVIESTSSLAVDQDKKSALGTNVPVAHRTGLVRLIEGSIVQNQTTTLYESKVLGTMIDGRYAQVIVSTSSYILPSSTQSEILPTSTQILVNQASISVIAPTPVVLEGSIAESKTDSDDTTTTETPGEEDDEKDDSKSKINFQSKKRTFTPAIRPFASRQRPTFAPKRSKAGVTTAATITRSDFTPTVTAVPASKANRFGARRSSASPTVQPTASGGRRFSRPKATRSSSVTSNQIKPTSSGFRRGTASRSTSSNIRPSSLFSGGGSRFRIRPTSVTGLSRSPSSKIVTETPPDSDNDLTTSVTEESANGEDATLPNQTTTESSRRTNPLLRFRRPPLTKSSVARSTSKPRTSTKGSTVATTTAKPKTVPSRPNALLNRQRAGGLFPRRNLFTTSTTTSEAPPEDEEQVQEAADVVDDDDDDDDDTDYESSQQHLQTESAPLTTAKPKVQIRPFKRRSKRQVSYPRFRRPVTSRSTTPQPLEIEVTEENLRTNFRTRYQGNRYRSIQTTSTTTTPVPVQRKRLSPSKPQRTQFTLREKEVLSNRNGYQSSRGTVRRSTTVNPRANRRGDSSIRRTTARSVTRSRPRGSTRRGSYDQNLDDNYIVPKFDGTITVTYKVPTEVTIPVVNGKVTEYKNIVTAKLSTEILAPHQYSTTINPIGKEVKILLTENTSVDRNGATFVTQYILNESPTTSIIFTPTQIRGRKTSFSHIIPSTAYQVEEVINTIQPALAAQAPLANILLSQLLLGGGVPNNPLLALQNNNNNNPTTPTTEYKTRTTTYVTTVTSTQQTVIPLTFRGKEILTTISEVNMEVVTATEFLTDTVIVTPTLPVFAQGPQLNTLLLPLLQQQLQQQQQQPQSFYQQTPAGVYNLNEPQVIAIGDEELEQSNLADNEGVPQVTDPSEVPKRKPSKKDKRKPVKVVTPKETSIITLYVSGKTPGDFTTVLSTITVDDIISRRKRHIEYVPVEPSKSLKNVMLKTHFSDNIVVEPGTKEVNIESSEVKETESLESIIGDVPTYFQTTKTMNPTAKYVRASEKDTRATKSQPRDFFA